jgi:hypothetical protein
LAEFVLISNHTVHVGYQHLRPVIRIRIRIRSAPGSKSIFGNADPDPEGVKRAKMKGKNEAKRQIDLVTLSTVSKTMKSTYRCLNVTLFLMKSDVFFDFRKYFVIFQLDPDLLSI